MNELLLWLITYGVHSSAIFLVVLLLDRTGLLVRDGAKDWMWRAVMVCGIFSASLQVGFGWMPWTGRATLPFELSIPAHAPMTVKNHFFDSKVAPVSESIKVKEADKSMDNKTTSTWVSNPYVSTLAVK